MKLLSYLFCVFLATGLHADSFEAGLEAYQRGEYATAADAFAQALEEEASAAAHHNLALALFRQGEAARAVWQLERAVQMAPFDPDTQFKLAALRQRLGLPSGEPRWQDFYALALSLNGWLLLAAASLWLGLGAWLLPAAAGLRPNLGLKALRALALLTLLLSLPAIALQLQLRARAIVVAGENTRLSAAPADAAPQTGSARPGERVRLIERHNAFAKVETEAGAEGWIPQDAVKPVFAPERTAPPDGFLIFLRAFLD